jgi:hypothetical protein
VCGRVYDADATRLKFGRQTTCSRLCSYEFRAAGKKNRTEHQCPVCGKRFERSPSQRKAQHGLECCSSQCAYKVRRRVVTRPYVLVAQVDRTASSKKAWESRRANPKPYPESARKKATADAIKRIQQGGGVSQFEREVAKVFRRLGIPVVPSLPVRRPDGTYAAVFDIYLPTRRIAVECHGTYWHGGRWSWDRPDATQAKNLAYEARKVGIA